MIVNRPEDAFAVLKDLCVNSEEERFAAIAFGPRQEIIDSAILTVGNDRFTIVCPRKVFRWALTRERPVTGIIVGHNHPSGDCAPSDHDKQATSKISEAGLALGLPLLDHIIVTERGFYSFAQAGTLPAWTQTHLDLVAWRR